MKTWRDANMILNIPAETMIQSEKEALQSQKLQQIVERAYEKTHFYKERLHGVGLTPSDIKSIHNIHQLPYTTEIDLSTHFPFGLLTMPISGVARFEQTIDPCIARGFTTQDLIWQQELIARSLVSCYIGITSVLLCLPEPIPSINARLVQQSAEMLGVTVIVDQTDDINTKLKALLDFGVTTLFATPTTLLSLADFLQQQGLSAQDLPVMNLLCEAQYTPETVRKELIEKFHLPVYTLYGCPHIMSLGIGGECYEKQGLHIHDDHFYPEIINPQTGIPLADHEPGELVITTLSHQATPLIRYRTGEMASITHEPCTCGRTTPRIIRV